MVEHLRADPAALAPRRDHEHRHAHAEAVRAGCSVLPRPGVPSNSSSSAARSTSRQSPTSAGTAATTWSKKPSFSSKFINRAVLHHTSGFAVSASSTCACTRRRSRRASADARCRPRGRRSRTRSAAGRARRRRRGCRSSLRRLLLTSVPRASAPDTAGCPAPRSGIVEVQQRVVAVVADVRIRRPAPEPGLVEPDAAVLIDLPADPGRLQALRVGRPAVAELVVVDDRPPPLPSLPSQPVHM